MARPITHVEALRIAAEAQCDPRSIKRYFNGEHVRTMLLERIEGALTRMGVALRNASTSKGTRL